MLYKTYLVRSGLLTAYKLDFYIWSDYLDALQAFSGEICYLLLKNQIFFHLIWYYFWASICYYVVSKLPAFLHYWLFTATTGYPFFHRDFADCILCMRLWVHLPLWPLKLLSPRQCWGLLWSWMAPTTFYGHKHFAYSLVLRTIGSPPTASTCWCKSHVCDLAY